MNESKNRIIPKLCVLYLLLWSVSPPMSIDMIYRLGALACVVLWMATAMGRGLWFDRKVILFLLLAILVAYIQSPSLSGILRSIDLYMLCIASIMFCYYRDKMEELEGITVLILAVFVLWNLRTFTAITLNPRIARAIVRNDESTYVYLRQGVGGYGLVYTQGCIFPMMVSWVVQAFWKKKLYFIVGAAWFGSFALLVLKSGYTIVIVASLVGLFILFFYRGRSIVPAVLGGMAVVAMLILLLVYWVGFRNVALNLFEGTKVAQKINDLVFTFEYGAYADSVESRIVRYTASLQTMLRYPIIGALWWSGGGGHSAILDAIAKYGWFGGYVYISCLFQPLRWIGKNQQDRNTHRIVNATLVSILLIVMLDSLSYGFMLVLVLFLPMLYQDIRRWREMP